MCDDIPEILAEMIKYLGFARVGTALILLRSLLNDWEYHTNRKADDGWQPCGKVVKS